VPSTASSIFENSTSCRLKNGMRVEALLVVDKDDEAGMAADEVHMILDKTLKEIARTITCVFLVKNVYLANVTLP
jgi:hypothetical protein